MTVAPAELVASTVMFVEHKTLGGVVSLTETSNVLCEEAPPGSVTTSVMM
jgi:hypothetical protein